MTANKVLPGKPVPEKLSFCAMILGIPETHFRFRTTDQMPASTVGAWINPDAPAVAAILHFCEGPQSYLAKFASGVNTEGLTLTDDMERRAFKLMRLCVGSKFPDHTEPVGIMTLKLLPPHSPWMAARGTATNGGFLASLIFVAR